MKKIMVLGVVICSLFITGCGCSKKEMKTVTCKKNIEFDTHSYNVEYIVTYDLTDKVKDYERNEVFKSDDQNLLANTLEERKIIYEDLNELIGYNFEGSLDENTMNTKINIEFKKVDSEKLFELAPSYQIYYNDEKKQFDINNILEDFKINGFECTE